jgi:uncharacterized protein YoxC
MDVDLSAIIRLLQEDPQQRAALRHALVGDAPDVEGALVRVAEAQRGTEERLGALTERVDALAQQMQALTERVDQLTQRLDRLTERVDALAQQMQALTERVGQLTQRLDRLTERVDGLAVRMEELAAAQRLTEDRLRALIDELKGMNDRLGKLEGYDLERRYREKGTAYLSRVARRLRIVDGNELNAMVEDAIDAGMLSEPEAQAIRLADAVFVGRRRGDGEPVYLVVEASLTVGRRDVRRARERADLLTRLGKPALAVVAGEFVPEAVAEAAHLAEVWQVTNGRTVGPDQDDDDVAGGAA